MYNKKLVLFIQYYFLINKANKNVKQKNTYDFTPHIR